MSTSQDIDILIARRLSGDMSESEVSDMDARLANDPQFAKAFTDAAAVWAKARSAELACRVSASKPQAWARVQARVSRPARRLSLWSRFARVAAVLIPLAVIASVMALLLNSPVPVVEYAATDAPDTITLSDGSSVILSPGSRLSFAQHDDSRVASLSGRASFSVTHDEHKPFSVQASDATILVLGTRFSVENWQGQNRIRTQVSEGHVAMRVADVSVSLLADEEASWDGSRLVKRHSHGAKLDLDSRTMVFSGASLQQVADELLSCYHDQLSGVDFRCAPDSVRITTSFRGQSLQSVIDELNLHFDKHISLANGRLLISD